MTSLVRIATLLGVLANPGAAQHHDAHAKGGATCPVMKSKIKDTSKAPHLMVNRETVFVCCPSCIPKLKKEPARYLKQVKDPVSGKAFAVTAKTPKIEKDGALFLFSSRETYQHGLQYLKGHGHGPHDSGTAPKHGPDHSGGGEGHAARPATTSLVQVGQAVPDFTVTDLSGNTLKLSQLQKRTPSGVVSLTYWCSFCHSCRHIERRLEELARQQREKAAVILIDASAGETPERISAFAKKTGLTLPILMDNGGSTVDLFGVRVTTTTLVIDADGVLRYRGQFGQGQQEPAAAALKAVLVGGEVAPKETAQRG